MLEEGEEKWTVLCASTKSVDGIVVIPAPDYEDEYSTVQLSI